MKLTEKNIGEFFQKKSWAHCYFRVEDVGTQSVWGIIIDPLVGIVWKELFPLHDDTWIRLRSANDPQ